MKPSSTKPKGKSKLDFGASLDVILASVHASKAQAELPPQADPASPQPLVEAHEKAIEPPTAVTPEPQTTQENVTATEESVTTVKPITSEPIVAQHEPTPEEPAVEVLPALAPRTPQPQRSVRPLAAKEVRVRGRANPNRVTVNLFATDNSALNSIAERLKRQGINFANRSEVIKVALRHATKASSSEVSDLFYEVKSQDKRFRPLDTQSEPQKKASASNLNEVALILFPADHEALAVLPRLIQAGAGAFVNRSDVIKIALRYSIHADPKELARIYGEVKAEDKRFRPAKTKTEKAAV